MTAKELADLLLRLGRISPDDYIFLLQLINKHSKDI